MSFDFGDRVRVHHVLRPLYLKWLTHVSVPVPSGHGPFMLNEEREVEPRLAVADRNGLPDVLPTDDLGEPLPEPSPLPGSKEVRRMLRRFSSGAGGVVVGRTYRHEGIYFAGHRASSYFGDDDYEPAQLDQTRRVKVYEVALGGSWPDGHPYPASIVTAIPDDMELESP